MLRTLVPLALVITAACGDAKEHFDRERTGVMEIIYAFRQADAAAATPDQALVRRVLVSLGQRDIELEPLQHRVDDTMRPALLVRIALSDWPPPAVRESAIAAIRREWGTAIEKADWSGNRIHLRATAAIDPARLRAILTPLDLVVVDEPHVDHDEGTGEYYATVKIGGTDVQIERALEAQLPGTDVIIASSLAVGPRPPRRRR